MKDLTGNAVEYGLVQDPPRPLMAEEQELAIYAREGIENEDCNRWVWAHGC